MFDLYLFWVSYWMAWAQYPIDMGEVRALRNDLDTQKKRINRHDEIIYGCYI